MTYTKLITIEEIEQFRIGAASKNPKTVSQENLDSLYNPLCEILNYIHNGFLFSRTSGQFNLSMNDADVLLYKTILKHLLIRQVNQYSIFEYFDYDIAEQTDGSTIDLKAYEPKDVITMLGTTTKFLIQSTDFYHYSQDPENVSLMPSDIEIYVKLTDLITSNMKYDGGLEYTEEQTDELNDLLNYLITNLGKQNGDWIEEDGTTTKIDTLTIEQSGTSVSEPNGDSGGTGGGGDTGGHRTNEEIDERIDLKLVDYYNKTEMDTKFNDYETQLQAESKYSTVSAFNTEKNTRDAQHTNITDRLTNLEDATSTPSDNTITGTITGDVITINGVEYEAQNVPIHITGNGDVPTALFIDSVMARLWLNDFVIFKHDDISGSTDDDFIEFKISDTATYPDITRGELYFWDAEMKTKRYTYLEDGVEVTNFLGIMKHTGYRNITSKNFKWDTTSNSTITGTNKITNFTYRVYKEKA